MAVVCFLQVAFLASHFFLSSEVNCEEQVHFQHFKFIIDEDVIRDHILQGHVFKRLTVGSATQCHMMCRDDCLCLSMNYFPLTKGNNCELNHANKDLNSSAIKGKAGAHYYDLARRYTLKGGRRYILGKHRCVNRCCRPNPCENGGVCEEICDTKSVRFNCSCPATYTGQRCLKIKYPRSCKDITKNGNLGPGRYIVYDSSDVAFSVNCGIEESDPRYAWTLIQSFSLSNRKAFAFGKEFSKDSPVNSNLNDVDWTGYRLSLSQMQSLANHSTHFRATCNYPTDGLNYTDYARVKLEDHDMFDTWNARCKMFEYLNIRGIECHNCTALTKQKSGRAWVIFSAPSQGSGCDFDGQQGSFVNNENNFGRYPNGTVNSAHRCSASPNSTTQHWFGSMIDF